jgi:flagellar hook assembly protein FlgD
MSIVPPRLDHSMTATVADAAPRARRGRRALAFMAAAPAVGAALVLAALGLPLPAAAAAPATTAGFIVAAPAAPGSAATLPSASAATLPSGSAVGSPPSPNVAAPLATAPATATSQSAGSALGVRRGRTLAAGVGPDGRPAVTLDTGARFDMIGILFRSTAAGARAVRFELRVSLDGRVWTPWCAIKADAQSGPAGSTLSRADLVTEPVWVGAGRYVQYEARSAGTSSAPVSDVRFACIESPPVAEAQTAAPASSPQLGESPVAGVRLGEPAAPAIVTRAQWGANEAYRGGPPSYGVVRCAFVHHTVNANSYTRAQAPALVRGIYYYHTKVNGWNDIGYNFLIDRFGTIYEGRYGGVTKAVMGAQVLGFNSMSTGVSLIGTFQSVAPSKAALTSLEQLLAWKLDLSHLDPLGTARVRCSTAEMYKAGQWVDVPVIVGHRQVNYTECPGDVLFGLLPAIRSAVAGIGDPKIYTPSATPVAFSPNGDGTRDTDRLRAGLSGNDDWTITLSNASGAVVARFSGTGPAAGVVWNGKDDAGRRLPDGSYTASFGATSPNGTARPAGVAVRIDTVSPAITALSVSPGVISPNGDRVADAARLAFTVSEACKVSLTVLDAQGAVVRTVAPVSAAAGAARLAWDGKVGVGSALVPAADGAYSLVVRAVDAAGNQSTVQRAVTVNDTLGHCRLAPAWLSPNGDGVDDNTLVSFQTTRTARVAIAIVGPSGAVVRRAALGSLAGGRHSWRWDGKNAGGGVVGDGAYHCTLTAVNVVGTVASKLTAHVDTVAPLAAWRSAGATLKLGKSLHAAYSVTDGLSPKAAVTIVVRSAGVTVATVSLPAAATGVARSWVFRPKARGRYAVRLSAVDLAGNRQVVASRLVVTVK